MQDIPPSPRVQIVVQADRPDHRYALGEAVTFSVSLEPLEKAPKGVKVRYKIGPERMDPVLTGFVEGPGPVAVAGGTLRQPGFLRLIATAEIGGRELRGLATAAFEPESIAANVSRPADFDGFWERALAENRKLPLDVRMESLPGQGPETPAVYQVSFQSFKPGERIYGVLSVPRGAGPFPALFIPPAHGAWALQGDRAMAGRGVMTLETGIHGIPVTKPQSEYDSLMEGRLKDYKLRGLASRDAYYFKRVFLGCSRAVDFLAAHPKFDGRKLAVYGGSQGGGLALAAAALNPKVRAVAVEYPGLCDLRGWERGRAGGWPQMFQNHGGRFTALPGALQTSKYYDMVHFAPRIRQPLFLTLGYNDEVCAPTSVYALFNLLPGLKQISVFPEGEHKTLPEQWAKTEAWILSRLLSR